MSDTPTRALAVQSQQPDRALSVFSSTSSFEQAQRIAKALVSSDLVPANYRGSDNLGNALIAMDTAGRMGLSPLVVMQNLHIIEGRPSWASSFIIGALNSCGLFVPIRFRIEKLGKRTVSFDRWEGPKGNRSKVTAKMDVEDMTCVAWTAEKGTGEILEGPPVTIAMAVAEGWYTKPGSKWVTMPDLMIRYRAAAFFGRLYAPHILNGMPTEDEVIDIEDFRDVTPRPAAPVAEEVPVEAKPEGRPTGVHAAMARGKAEEATKAEKPPRKKTEAAPAIEPEPENEEPTGDAGEVEDADFTDETDANDDHVPFGDAEDDDYSPA
ncbi:hypothetical protein [Aureimonas glaciei]|uniref:Recombinase RecT n=1 Tax=Aureimonas glaciei TaxID=1776957 RepID=A0A917D9X7_9HYPH|nr:hypothetical protein [Aureimonas glaciei]GGD19997.1 hypothetical protein GCM10011335_23650 [Aureimonas glaciei]